MGNDSDYTRYCYDAEEHRVYPTECVMTELEFDKLREKELRYLRKLVVHKCVLTHLLPLGTLTKLCELSLIDCGIDNETFEIISLPYRLVKLDISGNNLTAIRDMRFLDWLESFSVSRNRVLTLCPFASFPKNLVELDLSCNELVDELNFSSFYILESINLSKNHLSVFPRVPDIILDLDLSFNNLTAIELPEGMEYNRMENLNVDGNSFKWDVTAEVLLARFPHMRELWVADSFVDTSVFFRLFKLRRLNGREVTKLDKAKYLLQC